MNIDVQYEPTALYNVLNWYSGGKATGVAQWGTLSDKVMYLLKADVPTGVIARKLDIAESLVVEIIELESWRM